MDANLPIAGKPRLATHSKKWAMGVTATLLSLSMILAACGGDTSTGGDTVPPADDATVATPAVDDAAVDDAAVDDAAEDAADDAAATPEAEEETESSEIIETETGVITDTDVVTTTEVITETDVVTDVDVTTITTDTVVTTETEAEGESETLTESEVMTETDSMTDTDVATEDVDAGASMTDTEDVDAGTSMTDTGAVDTDAAAADTDTAAAAAATGAGAAMGISGVEEGQYVRASTLLDYDFENLNGEVSGDLEDLLIDLSTGRVLFTSIEYGGVFDLGDKDVVVPLSAFTIGEEGELVLNIDEATLENYPDVGNDWPDLNDPAWDDDVATFWNEAGIDSNLNFEEATTSVARASELMGLPAGNLTAGADAAAAVDAEAGTELGSIQDILIDLGTARAPYLIVTYGAGLDEDPYIIPISAFDTAAWNEGLNYQADFTPDMLQDAPRFDQTTYPEGTPLDRDFGDTVESWWNDMGFSNDLNNDGQLD